MGDLLHRSRIFNYLAAATPGPQGAGHDRQDLGAAPASARSRRAEPYDLVIVDAPATGHGIGFLQTPRTFSEIARVGPMHSQAVTLEQVPLRPGDNGCRDRRDRRGDAGQRVDHARAGAGRRDRHRRRPDLRQRGLPRPLRRRRRAAPRAGPRKRGPTRSRRRSARRSRSGGARLARASRSAGSQRTPRRPVATLPFLFEPELGSPRSSSSRRRSRSMR